MVGTGHRREGGGEVEGMGAKLVQVKAGKAERGKATSPVRMFFDRKSALGSLMKVRGRWLPNEAYNYDRGRRRVESSDK